MSDNKKILVEYIPINYDQHELNETIQQNHTVRVPAVLQRANHKNQNGRVYPKDILMRESQKYLGEFVQQRRALGELDHPECVSRCSIMTYDGWKNIENVIVGEKVLTLNMETNNTEYKPIEKVIAQEYKGTMYKIQGNNINVNVTPNHRFVVEKEYTKKREFITAEDMFVAQVENKRLHRSVLKTATAFEGIDTETIILPGAEIPLRHCPKTWNDTYVNALSVNTEVWFSFLGIYLAEGCVHNNTTISISQNDGEKANAIRELLAQLPSEVIVVEKVNKNGIGNTNILFQISDRRIVNAVKSLGSKYTKYIPVEYKQYSAKYLQQLLDWYHIGDGRTQNYRGYTNKNIFTVSEQLALDLHELLIKTGISSSMCVEASKKVYVYAGHEILPENKKPLHVIKFGKSKAVHLDWRFLTVEPYEYDGMVYCVQVPNETFYCMNDGKAFWSGNSRTVVNLANVSHNVVEMHWEGDDLVGIVEILSTPAGNIVKELMRSGIKLGLSSRGVGSVKTLGEGAVEVDDDYSLICFDIVSNPSTDGAFLSEGVNRSLEQNKLSRINNLIDDFFSELGK